jgi:hypothetical protein
MIPVLAPIKPRPVSRRDRRTALDTRFSARSRIESRESRI